MFLFTFWCNCSSESWLYIHEQNPNILEIYFLHSKALTLVWNKSNLLNREHMLRVLGSESDYSTNLFFRNGWSTFFKLRLKRKLKEVFSKQNDDSWNYSLSDPKRSSISASSLCWGSVIFMWNCNAQEENWKIRLPNWQNFSMQNLIIDFFSFSSDYRKIITIVPDRIFVSSPRRTRRGSSYFSTWHIDKMSGNSERSSCPGLIDSL